MIIRPHNKSVIVWPEDPDDGVSEKPILIECYSDVISIAQGDNVININYYTVQEFVKELKKCQPK